MNRSEDEGEPNPQESLVDQFVEITGVDRHRAQFYLNSSAFDLPVALSAFFEGGFDEIEEVDPEIVYDRQEGDVELIETPDDLRSPDQSEMSGAPRKPAADPKKKIATLFSQGAPGGKGSDSDSDDDGDKGQAFYVGGSEKSGQQVLGPPKKKGGDDIVQNFFQKAREHGAEQVDPSERAQAGAGSSSQSAFSGAGYRLGDTVKPSETIGNTETDARTEPTSVRVVMRMWQNGFTIDDGPLRTLEGPVERQFLEHVMQGRLPPELVQTHRGKKIELEMEDHRREEYKQPKATLKAFTGQGHKLGSPLPVVIGAGKVGEKATQSSASNGPGATSVTPPSKAPEVDESKPTTTIQVRLGNGERMVLTLNNNHTVQDLRGFICQMRPDLADREFVLMSGFPSKELTDEQSTLEGSNLLNAVVIQRFK